MEALKYLVSLVNDVLDMNKLQSGELKDQQILFDLTMVLRELNRFMMSGLQRKASGMRLTGKIVHTATAL